MKKFHLNLILAVLISIFFLFFSLHLSQAQTQDLSSYCQVVLKQTCQPTEGNNNCLVFKNSLQKCLSYYENQEKFYGNNIYVTRSKENTLKNEIYILNSKINKLNNEIYQTNLLIKNLNLKIEETGNSVNKTSQEISSSKEKIANIMRTIYEEDKRSFLDLVLSKSRISDFFSDLTDLEILGAKNQDILQSVESMQDFLKKQKNVLSQDKSSYQDMLALRQLQKEESQSTRKEQANLLYKTQGKERLYVQYKKEVSEKANIIRDKIFSLAGIANTKAPSFGQAIKIATYVGKKVGIRPAFLLAILSKESAIGRNVGRCYVTNTRTGGGIYANGSLAPRIMNPSRDLPVFLDIVKKLNLNPSKTPVSCWIKDYRYGRPWGWGGAMGPAQFIPSTWKIYEAKIAKYTGDNPPNPWSINDSFMASGIYLSELGAYRQTSWAEMRAASRYYGGSSKYARGAMIRAQCIQNFINNGSMSSYCENLILPKK